MGISKTKKTKATIAKKKVIIRKRNKYGIWQYGGRKQAQKQFGTSGATHEAEHVVGYKVLAPDLTRGESGEARVLEQFAPAYQEAYALHRNHIGTGNKSTADGSGFNATGYRTAQRAALEENSVSNAVQLNQLGYGFDKDFHKNQTGLITADKSYVVMIENMDRITYGKADGSTASVSVDAIDRAEMYLARKAARTGKWPTADEIKQAKQKFGIKC